MPDIDTSTYPKAKQQPGVLDTLSGAASLQSTLNQNKLFQQEFQSKLGLSKIYKNAMDPKTGEIDFNKIDFNDPSQTYGLPQAVQQSQAAHKQNIEIDIAKVQQAQAHLKAVAGYLSPLMKPGSTSKDVAVALAHAETNGLVGPDKRNEIWASLPRDPQTGQIDDSKVPAWAQQMQLNVMDATDRMSKMTGPVTMVQTPQGQIPMRYPEAAPSSQAGEFIPNVPGPTQQRYNPQTRQQEYVGVLPNGGMGGGQTGSGGAGVPGGGANPFPAGTPAAPALGAPEAAAVDASFGAKQGTELQSMADNVPARKALLGNLEGALTQFTSGPGQNWKMVAKAFANANSPFGSVFDAKSIASQEEFNKQAVQLAQQQFQALGGTGTDSKLDSAMHTSPNDALSKLGNKGIIAMLKGNEDAIAAKNLAWQQFKQQNGPQSYGTFSAQFNKSYDPRVFQSQYLSGDDKKKMVSGLTQPEKNKLFQAFQTAKQNGWIQ